MNDCIFCQIVKGESPSYKIWENEHFLAILSIFPNTDGFTVLMSKEHYPSYFVDVPEDVYIGIVKAAKEVAKLLDTKFEDVGRTGLIFEGFGVNHLHAKLFPMHGTKSEDWKQRLSHVEKYFQQYEGYISSHGGRRQSDELLASIQKKLTK